MNIKGGLFKCIMIISLNVKPNNFENSKDNHHRYINSFIINFRFEFESNCLLFCSEVVVIKNQLQKIAIRIKDLNTITKFGVFNRKILSLIYI